MVLKDVLRRKAPRSGDALLDVLLAGLLDCGVGCFIGKFTTAGLGAQANSWVGTGDNVPLEANDVLLALGADRVDEIGRAAGTSRYDTTHGLAAIIPGLIDELTPKGCVPTGDLATSMKGLDFAALRTV